VVGKPLPYVPPPPLPFPSLSSPFRQRVRVSPLTYSALVRMLSTPIRKCVQSSRYLPSGMSPLPTLLCPLRDRLTLSTYPDFLVRLSVKRLPSPRTGRSRPTYALVPDGLQHPKFKGLDSRKGHYVVCRRAAMQESFDQRGTTFSSTHSQSLEGTALS